MSRHPVRIAAGIGVLATAMVVAPMAASDASHRAATSPANVASAPTSSGHHHPSTPHHLVFIVLDQLRPEFIDAFHMNNVKALMAHGTSFPNAYLGHMGSETVVSHNVMTSGLLPKHMGWADEWYRDTDNVLGRGANAAYVSGSLPAASFDALITHGGYKKIPDYLHQKFPGKIVAAIGQKNYATNSMGGPGADIRITMSGRSFDCDPDASTTVTNWRGPTGTNVPTYITGKYIANTSCTRYYVNSSKDPLLSYGTATTSPAWMYPLEHNRDVPGDDPDHQGGDVWSTDAALEVMTKEDWSGILLTLGGIDKAGHMWGGLNDVPPYPPGTDPMAHMAAQAKTADDQVGRIMAKLGKLGIADDTLVVLTTDHAQLTAEHYYGVDKAGQGNFNWYYGSDEVQPVPEAYLDPSPEIKRLIMETGNVRLSMQDSAIRTWLTDTSRSKMRAAADVIATLGGVRAAYYRTGHHYSLRWAAPRHEWSFNEWKWWKAHGQEIVNTEAASYGPDVIGLLADNTSYGVKGDHGGAQESVQRIPIIFAGPGVKAGSRAKPAMRSVDITPTILRELGIRQSRHLDGTAYSLP